MMAAQLHRAPLTCCWSLRDVSPTDGVVDELLELVSPSSTFIRSSSTAGYCFHQVRRAKQDKLVMEVAVFRMLMEVEECVVVVIVMGLMVVEVVVREEDFRPRREPG